MAAGVGGSIKVITPITGDNQVTGDIKPARIGAP